MFGWLKDTFKKLYSSHQSDVEKEFQTVRKILLARKMRLAELIADQAQLERKLVNAKSDQAKIDALSAELNALREEKEIAGKDLSDIENEVKQAFTKKEIFFAQRNNESEPNNLSRELKIILAILLVWQLIGLLLKLRPMF